MIRCPNKWVYFAFINSLSLITVVHTLVTPLSIRVQMGVMVPLWAMTLVYSLKGFDSVGMKGVSLIFVSLNVFPPSVEYAR